MTQKVVTARLSVDIYNLIAAKASTEGRSLSGTIALVLSECLKSEPSANEHAEDSSQVSNTHDAERLAKLEQRVSQLEAQQQPAQRAREGKRRR